MFAGNKDGHGSTLVHCNGIKSHQQGHDIQFQTMSNSLATTSCISHILFLADGSHVIVIIILPWSSRHLIRYLILHSLLIDPLVSNACTSWRTAHECERALNLYKQDADGRWQVSGGTWEQRSVHASCHSTPDAYSDLVGIEMAGKCEKS